MLTEDKDILEANKLGQIDRVKELTHYKIGQMFEEPEYIRQKRKEWEQLDAPPDDEPTEEEI